MLKLYLIRSWRRLYRGKDHALGRCLGAKYVSVAMRIGTGAMLIVSGITHLIMLWLSMGGVCGLAERSGDLENRWSGERGSMWRLRLIHPLRVTCVLPGSRRHVAWHGSGLGLWARGLKLLKQKLKFVVKMLLHGCHPLLHH